MLEGPALSGPRSRRSATLHQNRIFMKALALNLDFPRLTIHFATLPSEPHDYRNWM